MELQATDHIGFYESLVEDIGSYKGKKEALVELAPDFFKLMTNLLEDHRTPRDQKMLINSAIAYFITPYDVIPEAVYGPIGFIDDIYLCMYVINDLKNKIDIKIINDAWEGIEPLDTVIEDAFPKVIDYLGNDTAKILDYIGIDIDKS